MPNPGTDDHIQSPSNNRYRLLACGANIYGQISPDESHGCGILPEEYLNANTTRSTTGSTTIAATLFSSLDNPTVVFSAKTSLRVLWVGANSICVERDGFLFLRGLLPTLAPSDYISKLNSGARELRLPLPASITSHDIQKAFGTLNAFLGIVLRDGKIYNFSIEKWEFNAFSCPFVEQGVRDLQINRMGEICFLLGDGSLEIYAQISSVSDNLYDASLYSFIEMFNDESRPLPISILCLLPCDDQHPGNHRPEDRRELITSVAATSTGFVALTNMGRVYTYGDKRFNSLGRGTNTDEELNTDKGIIGQGWALVDALDGIFIIKVSANPGGHVQLALAEDGTGYIWGGDGTEYIDSLPGTKADEGQALEEVGMIDIPDEVHNEPVEFCDIACGEEHVVLVDTSGRGIWVSGASDIGQLGFGAEYKSLPIALGVDEELKRNKGKWRKWPEDVVPAGRSIQVTAGFGCTLLVINEGETDTRDMTKKRQ